MTQVYQVLAGDLTRVFKTLKQAHDYVKEHNPEFWQITRHTIVRPTVDNMLAIINEQGGRWSLDETFICGS